MKKGVQCISEYEGVPGLQCGADQFAGSSSGVVEKLEEENVRPAIEGGEHFSFAPLDTMIKDNLWICPITPKHQDSAYYSITKNEIIVPEKSSSNRENRSMERFSTR